MTALFMYEPITFTRIDIPASHLNPLSPAIEEQLIAHEIAEGLAATEVLLKTAATVTKNKPDHMWLSSGHVSKVFQLRKQLQELSHSLRTSSVDLTSRDACDADIYDQDTDAEAALRPTSKLGVEQDGRESVVVNSSGVAWKDNALSGQRAKERLALALKYKTKVVLLAQALFEDASSEGKSNAVRGTRPRIFSFQGASVSMSSSSYEREEENKDSESPSTPGGGISGTSRAISTCMYAWKADTSHLMP
jgi:hypothetical protein